MDKMTIDFILRILVAALLGGMVGLEREYRDKAAGFRTHFLVALGSALFMIISAYGFSSALVSTEHRLDVSRVAAQVVSGIGFIGAGTIIFQKNAVRGLTTAASIWVTAAIGLACGAGMYILAAAATLFVLLGLEAFNFFLRRFDHHRNEKLPTTIIIMCMLMAPLGMQAQGSNDYRNYYRAADGKSGAKLKTALYQIIKNPDVVDYDSLWHAYQFSDARQMGDSLIIWDMYSSISRYSIYSKLHGNGGEGIKGFQREHSMPKSWFNPKDRNSSGSLTYKDVKPMYSDIVHVIPTDGTVNNKRSNNAYGEITDSAKVEWQSAEGFSKQSKKGGCGTSGWKEYLGSDASKKRVFEPNDEYKGDLARIYFYMATCYEDSVGTWTSDMFDAESDDGYQPFAKWAFDMLMRWSAADPVSQKEIDRNEACYQLQGNRNPFIDYPGLENYIWGENLEVPFESGAEQQAEEPVATDCEIALNSTTFDVDWTETGFMRNYYERPPLVYRQDGIDVTFAYGIEGSRMYCSPEQIRLYNKNVLTFKAHKNTMTNIEFTVPEKADDKEFIPSVGEMDGYTWTGNADEVQFTSTYTSSWPEANANKHIQIASVKITVAELTGISQKPTISMSSDAIYTLSGVRVDSDNLRPGIYIKNGKKFFVK